MEAMKEGWEWGLAIILVTLFLLWRIYKWIRSAEDENRKTY